MLNITLSKKITKFNFILSIFLEKQLFYFICSYLFIFQRIVNYYTTGRFSTTYKNYLMNFCNKFRVSNLFCFKYSSFSSSYRQVYKYYRTRKIRVRIKRIHNFNKQIPLVKPLSYKAAKKEVKFNDNKSKIFFSTDLEFKDFYFNKFLIFGKQVHSSLFFSKRKVNKSVDKFKNFSLIMIRFFKFKVIYSIFFRLRNQFPRKFRFISFLGLRRITLALRANKLLLKNGLRFGRKMVYFRGKYFSKVKFTLNIITSSSRSIRFGHIFRNNSDYFINKLTDKIFFRKKLHIVATGRSFIYRFSEKLGVPLIYRFTKYKYLNSFIKKAKNLNDFNTLFWIYKREHSALMLHSEFIKKRNSNNYFIKKPLQKLIISGRKKLGYNIFNNLFLSMSKFYKGSLLKQVEVVNSIFKRLFIRATVKNIERNNSALGVKQRCSILMGFEELKSRVNLFFFDYMRSLCKKKTKLFRVRKVKDLVFSDFFNFSSRCAIKKSSTHLAHVFADINEFMNRELNFRGVFRVYRFRLLEVPKRARRSRFIGGGARRVFIQRLCRFFKFKKYRVWNKNAIKYKYAPWKRIFGRSLRPLRPKFRRSKFFFKEKLGLRSQCRNFFTILRRKFIKNLKENTLPVVNKRVFFSFANLRDNKRFAFEMLKQVYRDFKKRFLPKVVRPPFIDPNMPSELKRRVKLKLSMMYIPSKLGYSISKNIRYERFFLKELVKSFSKYSVRTGLYQLRYKKKALSRYVTGIYAGYHRHIEKSLRMKAFVFGDNIIGGAIPNLFYRKSPLFTRKCQIFLNKAFIYSRFGNFKFTNNYSRFRNYKVFRTLGPVRYLSLRRYCSLLRFNSMYFTKLIRPTLRYSAKKYRARFVQLKLLTIRTAFRISRRMVCSKPFFAKKLRSIFRINKFLRFRYQRSVSVKRRVGKAQVKGLRLRQYNLLKTLKCKVKFYVKNSKVGYIRMLRSYTECLKLIIRRCFFLVFLMND